MEEAQEEDKIHEVLVKYIAKNLARNLDNL